MDDHDQHFNPFTDRAGRHIRNSLSAACIRSLKETHPGWFESTIADWLNRTPVPAHRGYIRDRRHRYRKVFDEIVNQNLPGLLQQTAILWNHHLFFEVHELLEDRWRLERDERKKAIQGLIIAAAAYEHMSCGRMKSAERLSSRAVDLLDAHRVFLKSILNLANIVQSLRELQPEPPKMVLRSQLF